MTDRSIELIGDSGIDLTDAELGLPGVQTNGIWNQSQRMFRGDLEELPLLTDGPMMGPKNSVPQNLSLFWSQSLPFDTSLAPASIPFFGKGQNLSERTINSFRGDLLSSQSLLDGHLVLDASLNADRKAVEVLSRVVKYTLFTSID